VSFRTNAKAEGGELRKQVELVKRVRKKNPKESSLMTFFFLINKEKKEGG